MFRTEVKELSLKLSTLICIYIYSSFFTIELSVSSWLLVLRTNSYISYCVISSLSCRWPAYYSSSLALCSADSIL